MQKVKLHFPDYNRLGDNPTTAIRIVSLPEVPKDTQYLLVSDNGRMKSYLVTNTYLPVSLVTKPLSTCLPPEARLPIRKLRRSA